MSDEFSYEEVSSFLFPFPLLCRRRGEREYQQSDLVLPKNATFSLHEKSEWYQLSNCGSS